MTSTKKPVVRHNGSRPAHGFDGSGHLSARETERLLELSREGRSEDPGAFIEGTSTEDDLAEELAEAAVASMTTGEDELGDDLEAEVDEERGGPFTETSAHSEFAGGTDESNIAEATREPVPTANAVEDE
jgi:hypothetical protein